MLHKLTLNTATILERNSLPKFNYLHTHCYQKSPLEKVLFANIAKFHNVRFIFSDEVDKAVNMDRYIILDEFFIS